MSFLTLVRDRPRAVGLALTIRRSCTRGGRPRPSRPSYKTATSRPLAAEELELENWTCIRPCFPWCSASVPILPHFSTARLSLRAAAPSPSYGMSLPLWHVNTPTLWETRCQRCDQRSLLSDDSTVSDGVFGATSIPVAPALPGRIFGEVTPRAEVAGSPRYGLTENRVCLFEVSHMWKAGFLMSHRWK